MNGDRFMIHRDSTLYMHSTMDSGLVGILCIHWDSVAEDLVPEQLSKCGSQYLESSLKFFSYLRNYCHKWIMTMPLPPSLVKREKLLNKIDFFMEKSI
jgi:hypothetical protein